MKITTEDSYTIVTIEDKRGKVDLDSFVELCRCSALAHGFHADVVSALMPNENELDDIISDGINAQNIADMLDKDAGLTEYID